VRRLADRFGEAARKCDTLAALRELLADAANELGFDYFALLHHASLTAPKANHVRIDNYPSGWTEELVAGGLAADDPVHCASRRTNAAFDWSELGSLITIEARQKIILERSRRHGIGEGLTVPVNVPGEPGGSCSFAMRKGRALRRENILCAELIGSRGFRAARRLVGYPAVRSRPHLSPRELQCLRLVAAGKTDWEIAVILGISRETARQYVKRARSAYDAVTRAQLVVYGLRDEWLTFEEAIDPRF
jgi:LuxR family transcriptional regulator, quorum-sensing system regulator CciR